MSAEHMLGTDGKFSFAQWECFSSLIGTSLESKSRRFPCFYVADGIIRVHMELALQKPEYVIRKHREKNGSFQAVNVLACTVCPLLLYAVLWIGRKNPYPNKISPSSSSPFITESMERRGNGGKQLGFCQKFINFIAKNLSPYTHRQVTAGSVMKSTPLHSIDEEGEVSLAPPIITIPVEQVEVPMISAESMQEGKKKNRKNQVRTRSGSQEKEKGALRDDQGRHTLPRRPSTGIEKSNMASSGRPPMPERSEGGGSAPRTTKQVERSMSNIDKKVDAFIRERKESFAS